MHLLTRSSQHTSSHRRIFQGFTLAEALTTLLVIGVAASMTIPVLIQNHQASVLRTQFLKSYSIIKEAYKLMQVDNLNAPNSIYGYATFYKSFSKYLKNPIDCGNYYETRNNKKPCYAPNTGYRIYKSLDGTILDNYGERLLDDGILVLPDNTILYFENNKEGDSDIYISIDLNGIAKGPNVWGYDLFTFQVMSASDVVPMGDTDTRYSEENYCNISKPSGRNGIACAFKAKNDSEYFKKIVKIH